MKKTVLALAMLVALAVQAQTASSIVGSWSFDKINEAALTTAEQKEAMPMLASMFGSFEIRFDKELYELKMMGREESGAYTFANKVITLREGTKITFVNDSSALLAAGNGSFYLKRGAYVKEETVYTFLTKNSYEAVAVDATMLCKKWKVREVKTKADDEEGEMTATMLNLMNFEFKADGTFLLTIMGQGQAATWELGEQKGEIRAAMGTETANLFIIKEQTANSMIIEMEENGALMYLVPDTE